MNNTILNLSTSPTYYPGSKSILLKFSILFFLLVWIVGFTIPSFTTLNNQFITFFLTKIYSTVCHQDSHKCISFGSEGMIVCARCAGIYLGALLSLILNLLNFQPSISKILLSFSIIPLLLDVFLTSVGIYTYIHFVSLATGVLFGAITCFLLLDEFEKFTIKNKIV